MPVVPATWQQEAEMAGKLGDKASLSNTVRPCLLKNNNTKKNLFIIA